MARSSGRSFQRQPPLGCKGTHAFYLVKQRVEIGRIILWKNDWGEGSNTRSARRILPCFTAISCYFNIHEYLLPLLAMEEFH